MLHEAKILYVGEPASGAEEAMTRAGCRLRNRPSAQSADPDLLWAEVVVIDARARGGVEAIGPWGRERPVILVNDTGDDSSAYIAGARDVVRRDADVSALLRALSKAMAEARSKEQAAKEAAETAAAALKAPLAALSSMDVSLNTKQIAAVLLVAAVIGSAILSFVLLVFREFSGDVDAATSRHIQAIEARIIVLDQRLDECEERSQACELREQECLRRLPEHAE